MKADTQLEYAIFQLTPTRTRCELHVVAKGFTYKLASGLLKPFVSHLRAAEEQLARGGYSIRLEPPDPSKASWFTKGTMERFVRFVSTPEVLERVSSVEVELLELEETTRQQTADTCESNGAGQTDNNTLKTASSQLSPGGKPVALAASEKATKVASESVDTGVEESTKQRLLRALDARRMMLQKEQGMAFARALAAGFNLENMDDLVLFAECFGANRLREACTKFLTLCKKRQEAGLGLEDLELMATENAQTEMSYMGGNAMGFSWPDPQGNGLDQLQSPIEARPLGGEDGTEKLTRRGSLDETLQSGPSLRPANGSGMMGDCDGGPAIVNGHPMMAAWQGQPPSQYMPGVPPYGAMHPGLPNHFDPSYGFPGPARSGQPGLPYPHYLGSPYMPPPYPDGNGWQAHSSVPPPYWSGNQTHDIADGGHPRPQHQQTISTPFSRDKDAPDSAKFIGDDVHDDQEEFSSELAADRSRRHARRSASPRRRSASPMRRVQVGRSGGSKRSGMVVIRNINYIAPKAQQQDNKEVDDSENSDSWSEDGESDEDETLKNSAETLRASVEDAVGLVEGKNRATKDGKKKHSKKEKKKASSKDSVRGADDVAGPDEDDFEKNIVKQTEDVWMFGKREKGADDSKNLLREEALFSLNRKRQQGSYDPALESACVDKQDRKNAQERQSAEDSILLSQRDGYMRAAQSPSFDMFDQEYQEHQDRKKMSLVDDSSMIADSRSTTIAKGSTTIESDFEYSSKVMEQSQAEKKISDDSFIVLDRSTAREGGNGEWRIPLNLESEMPSDQNLDKSDPAQESKSFEPDDLFMVPERSQDTYKRAWNTPLDYDMHVLAADMIDNGHEIQGKEDEEENTVVEPDVDEEIEVKSTEPSSRKLSEKDAKAKAMKEMLERRKLSGGGRPGRPNPLAEAQLRAEKLRLYKAGLQKSKKEKEEEERKRIEDLRNQRQQRIAARSSPGVAPSSPSLARGARTTPVTGTKSSPKAPSKLSNGYSLSPSLSLERVSRVARPASGSPKSGENVVSRSVSSLTEMHRESKKPTLAVRASTGSQLSSHKLRSERVTQVNPRAKINGHTEDKLGRSKSSRTDERVSRTDSGLAEERIRRSESARLEDKIGRTDCVREKKVGHTESGRIAEKSPFTSKTVKRISPQEVPTVAPKSVKVLSMDSKLVKKASTVPSKPVQKRNAVAPVVEEIAVEQKALLLSEKEVPKVEIFESPLRAMESEKTSPVLAKNSSSNEIGKAPKNGAVIENDNVHVEIVSLPLTVTESSVSNAEKAYHENRAFIPNAAVTVLEPLKEDALHINSCLRAESVAGSDDTEREVEVGFLVGEDYHAPVAHVSPSEDNHTAFMKADLHVNDAHLVGHYSPPFAPPSEYSLSPLVDVPHLSSASQQEFTIDANTTDLSTRSRKKWGDSKAKGLKRLLLLGRKSGRSSAHSASDVQSEGEEEDSPSSNGKNLHNKFTGDMDSFNEQASAVSIQSDVSSANSAIKGSRSIFSLSTFRGKSTAKV